MTSTRTKNQDTAAIRCPRCSSPMGPGMAFVEHRLPDGVTTDEDPPPATLEGCLKCHSCGYSEELPADAQAA